MTSGERFGIVTKLSAGGRAERDMGRTFGKTFEKKFLTNRMKASIIAMFRRTGRVPCKLNNVTNEKHQTDGSKEPTKSSGLRVESITEGTEQNKEAMEIAL